MNYFLIVYVGTLPYIQSCGSGSSILSVSPDTEPVPDPIRIQGFDDQNWSKIIQQIFFFYQKLQFTFVLKPLKENIQHFKKLNLLTFFSVADPGCLSRIPDLIFTHPGFRISDPGSRIPDPGSRIPDPKTGTKERGEKKFVVITFYVSANFTKLHIILVLMCWRKKFGPIFKEL